MAVRFSLSVNFLATIWPLKLLILRSASTYMECLNVCLDMLYGHSACETVRVGTKAVSSIRATDIIK